MRDAISFSILLYFALRLAQVLAEAFAVEEVCCGEGAVVCFAFAVVLKSVVLWGVVVGLVEVFFVLVVCNVFFLLDVGVVVFFMLVVVGLDVCSTALGFEVLELVEAEGLAKVLVVVDLVELDGGNLQKDEADDAATNTCVLAVVAWVVLFAALGLELVGTRELETVVTVFALDETEVMEAEAEIAGAKEEIVRDEANATTALVLVGEDFATNKGCRVSKNDLVPQRPRNLP